MTPAEASTLLELPDSATPEQIETRFLELRTRLEDKIAKAPTPGLKAKYRETLEEITRAFETLTLAADSSSLPVLKKESGARSPEPGIRPTQTAASSASPSTLDPRPSTAAAKKSGSKEFLLVAAIAVAVLGAGGWWVMKTKAENEEKARVAAEAKVEAERQAQLAREKAEQDRRDREAAEKAERERQERLLTSLRSRMAELNVAFDAALRTEQTAERELSELKSQERDLARDLKGSPTPASRKLTAQVRAQDRFVSWLRETLPTHPARVTRARAEELVSARALDDATAAVDAYAGNLEKLRAEIARSRMEMAVTGTLELTSNLPGVTWKVVDAFGATLSGETPAVLADVALGAARVTFSRPRWDDINQSADIRRDRPAMLRADFVPATLRITTRPAEAEASIADVPRNPDGTWSLEPGEYTLIARAPGFAPRHIRLRARTGQDIQQEVVLSQDYTDATAALALQRLPEIGDQTALVEAAGSLAALHGENGDRAGIRQVAALLLTRSQRWPKPELMYHLMGVVFNGCKLGEAEAMRPLAELCAQQVAGFRLEPINEAGLQHNLAAIYFMVGDDAKTNAAIDRAVALYRQNWVNASLTVTQSHLNDWRRTAFDSVAQNLSTYGLVEQAERWKRQADTIQVGSDIGFSFRWPINLHFDYAKLHLRQRRNDEAMAAIRRGVDQELTEARRRDADAVRAINSGSQMDRVKIAVALHYFYSLLHTAHISGNREGAESVSQYYAQLNTAGQIDFAHSQPLMEMFRTLQDPAAYRAKVLKLQEEQASRFERAATDRDASAAVKALAALWYELRTYRLADR